MSAYLILTPLSGAVVGLVLGLVGGGGSILAVPLLIYVVGILSTHIAIGTSAVAVAASAAVNLGLQWQQGQVKWPCAIVFSLAGVGGAFSGANLAKTIDGQALLIGFGVLMLIVGVTMIFRKSDGGRPDVHLDKSNIFSLGPKLVLIGFGVGGLAGFFGIGGGFLIVPGLMLATGMPLAYAIGTSLVAVTSFGAATATSYAFSGLVDWPIAGLFVLGGAIGGLAGVSIGKMLAVKGRTLAYVFAGVVVLAGTFILIDGARTLWQFG